MNLLWTTDSMIMIDLETEVVRNAKDNHSKASDVVVRLTFLITFHRLNLFLVKRVKLLYLHYQIL